MLRPCPGQEPGPEGRSSDNQKRRPGLLKSQPTITRPTRVRISALAGEEPRADFRADDPSTSVAGFIQAGIIGCHYHSTSFSRDTLPVRCWVSTLADDGAPVITKNFTGRRAVISMTLVRPSRHPSIRHDLQIGIGVAHVVLCGRLSLPPTRHPRVRGGKTNQRRQHGAWLDPVHRGCHAL
jgi:hypothetical protein